MNGKKIDTARGERLPWPRDSRHTVLCPARTHDAPVRVLSCLGSHLFGSDEGRGISFLAPASPFSARYLSGWCAGPCDESDDSRARGCLSLERESGAEDPLLTVWTRVRAGPLGYSPAESEATDRPAFVSQAETRHLIGDAMLQLARSLPAFISVQGYKGRKVRTMR